MTAPDTHPRADRNDGRSFPFFTAFLALSTVALSVLCLMLVRENRALKARMMGRGPALAAGTGAAAEPIQPGDRLEGLTLVGEDGGVWFLRFADGGGEDGAADARPTLVLVMAASCGYCGEAVPAWDSVLAELGVGLGGQRGGSDPVRVAAVQTDARTPSEIKRLLHTAPVFMAQDPRSSWLMRVPIEPAALLIDARGEVIKTWFGLPAAADASDLRAALLSAAASASR